MRFLALLTLTLGASLAMSYGLIYLYVGYCASFPLFSPYKWLGFPMLMATLLILSIVIHEVHLKHEKPWRGEQTPARHIQVEKLYTTSVIIEKKKLSG